MKGVEELAKPGAQEKIQEMINTGKKPEGVSASFAAALAGLLPAVAGAVFGGDQGAGIGSDIGIKAMGQMTDAQLAQQNAVLEQQKAQQGLLTQGILADQSAKADIDKQNDQQSFIAGQGYLNRQHDLNLLGIRANQAAAEAQNKPLTDAQTKNASFAGQGKVALTQYDTMKKNNADYNESALNLTNVKDQIASILPDEIEGFLTSENYAAEKPAKEAFVNAVLRPESGAAIGRMELASRTSQLFPVPGDSDVIKQRKAIMRQALQSSLDLQGKALTPEQYDAIIAQHQQSSKKAPLSKEAIQAELQRRRSKTISKEL